MIPTTVNAIRVAIHEATQRQAKGVIIYLTAGPCSNKSHTGISAAQIQNWITAAATTTHRTATNANIPVQFAITIEHLQQEYLDHGSTTALTPLVTTTISNDAGSRYAGKRFYTTNYPLPAGTTQKKTPPRRQYDDDQWQPQRTDDQRSDDTLPDAMHTRLHRADSDSAKHRAKKANEGRPLKIRQYEDHNLWWKTTGGHSTYRRATIADHLAQHGFPRAWYDDDNDQARHTHVQLLASSPITTIRTELATASISTPQTTKLTLAKFTTPVQRATITQTTEQQETNRQAKIQSCRATAILGDDPGALLPEMVRVGARYRPMQDGGGRCSPGRIRPENRPQQSLTWQEPIIAQIMQQHQQFDAFHKLYKDDFGRQPRPTPTTPKPAPYKATTPYSDEAKQQLLDKIGPHIGSPSQEIAPRQPFPLKYLAKLGTVGKLRDEQYLTDLHDNDGGNLGIEEHLPQCPEIYPNDETKAEHADLQPLKYNLTSYESALENMTEIRKAYVEERALGMTAGPFPTARQVKQVVRSDTFVTIPQSTKKERGPLGTDKFRNLSDGRATGHTGQIHAHTHSKGEPPGIPDERHAMALDVKAKRQTIALKWDVSRAHRRTAAPPKDWKYLVVLLELLNGILEYWVNLVHTFGVASAQYYWGRTAAFLLRLILATFTAVYWAFVYVDDYSLLMELQHGIAKAAMILFYLEALGMPIAWHKVYLNVIHDFVGFTSNIPARTIALTEEKQTDILNMTDPIVNNRSMKNETIAIFTHKMAWAAQAIEHVKPYLAPLCAYTNDKDFDPELIRHPPTLVRFCTAFIRDHIKDKPIVPLEFRRQLKGRGATDAHATKTKAGIGGWHLKDDEDSKWQARWFMEPVTKDTHPWVYKTKTPQQYIAAIEMLGDVYYVEMIGPDNPRGAGEYDYYATAATDNQGSAYIINKHYTSKYPNCCLSMQLTTSMHKYDLYLRAIHKEREGNVWADQLANQNDNGFDPAKRWHLTEPLTTLTTALELAEQMGLDKPKQIKNKEYLQDRLAQKKAQHRQQQSTGNKRPRLQ